MGEICRTLATVIQNMANQKTIPRDSEHSLGLIALAAIRHATGRHDGTHGGRSLVRDAAEASCLEV